MRIESTSPAQWSIFIDELVDWFASLKASDQSYVHSLDIEHHEAEEAIYAIMKSNSLSIEETYKAAEKYYFHRPTIHYGLSDESIGSATLPMVTTSQPDADEVLQALHLWSPNWTFTVSPISSRDFHITWERKKA